MLFYKRSTDNPPGETLVFNTRPAGIFRRIRRDEALRNDSLQKLPLKVTPAGAGVNNCICELTLRVCQLEEPFRKK
jgi:hypothetical protein